MKTHKHIKQQSYPIQAVSFYKYCSQKDLDNMTVGTLPNLIGHIWFDKKDVPKPEPSKRCPQSEQYHITNKLTKMTLIVEEII